GVYVIEITGKPGSWHPHVHALVEQKFLSWKTFQSRWQALTGATAFHVKKIPAGAAERYITKYLTKPTGTPAEVAAIAADLRHVRLFQPFGSWHGLIGSWVKAPYGCPECGECVWYPFDQFVRDHESGKNDNKAPPGREVRRLEVIIRPRPVVKQAVLGHEMMVESVDKGVCRSSDWDSKGRY
ncbi:MAG: hypothetical protein V3W18_00005, partial [candidate division Zixibacteria bacterium]